MLSIRAVKARSIPFNKRAKPTTQKNVVGFASICFIDYPSNGRQCEIHRPHRS